MSTTCTAIGCPPSFTLKTPIDLSYEQLQQAAVTICRNAQCLSGMFNLNQPPTPEVGPGVNLPDFGAHPERIDELMRPRGRFTVWGTAQGMLSLDVSWTAWSSTELASGDTYRIELDAADGARFATEERVNDYQMTYPNGSACGPACVWIRIDRNPPPAPAHGL